MNTKSQKKMAQQDNPFLVYGSGILVSTIVNNNLDVFKNDVVWEARNSPKNTHVNIEHQKKKIIGHIYDSEISIDGQKWDKDTQPDEDFDIRVFFAL